MEPGDNGKMLMKNPFGGIRLNRDMLVKFLLRGVLPVVAVLLSFALFGPAVGLLTVLAGLLAILWFGRATWFGMLAGRKIAENDDEGALKLLALAVKSAPSDVRLGASYGFLLLKYGYPEKAERELARVATHVKTEADRNTLRSNEALILWKKGDLPGAIRMLEELIATYRTTAVYSTLGYFYIAAGDREKALAFNEEAARYNEANAVILDNLALSKHLNGDDAGAVETYRRLMEKKPGFPDAYWNYGNVLEATGDLEKAAYMYRNAMTMRFRFTNTISKADVEARLADVERRIEEAAAANAKPERNGEEEGQ